MFRLDLNGDGKEEVFLSHQNDTNARAGNIWEVYISKGNKYLRSTEFPSLAYDTFILKKCAITARYRLFSVISSSGKAKPGLNVYEIIIEKNAVTMKKLAWIELFDDDYSADAVLALLEDSPYKLVVAKGNLEKLKEAMKLPPVQESNSSREGNMEKPVEMGKAKAKE